MDVKTLRAALQDVPGNCEIVLREKRGILCEAIFGEQGLNVPFGYGAGYEIIRVDTSVNFVLLEIEEKV